MRALKIMIRDSASGKIREERYARSPVRIGRNSRNDLCLSFSFVSGRHAQVEGRTKADHERPGPGIVVRWTDAGGQGAAGHGARQVATGGGFGAAGKDKVFQWRQIFVEGVQV